MTYLCYFSGMGSDICASDVLQANVEECAEACRQHKAKPSGSEWRLCSDCGACVAVPHAQLQ